MEYQLSNIHRRCAAGRSALIGAAVWALVFAIFGATASLADIGAHYPNAGNMLFQRFGSWEDDKQSSLIQDVKLDRRGRIWIATEDSGVWMYDSANSARNWTQFNATSGLADDNCRVILCDKLGRIWVGTESSGLSVYNGKIWKTYDSLNGPLGSHIFAIAQDPLGGDVWISTENGLSRYSDSTKTWQYFTTADGLPSNQSTVLTFDGLGNLYVGSQCNGLAIGSTADGYKSWRIVPCPLRAPTAAEGLGLPSALINAILVAKDGKIYVGTDSGLAISVDRGKVWRYIRGTDWAAKAAGQYPAPAISPSSSSKSALDEDYITTLAEDNYGRLWIGHRSTGLEVVDPATFDRIVDTNAPSDASALKSIDYVTSVCSTPAGVIFGTYGGGLGAAPVANARPGSVDPPSSPAALPPFPSTATPPTIEALTNSTAQLAKSEKKIQPGEAYYLGEDWDTKGDWVGRYGRQYATLCATRAPLNHEFISDTRFTVNAFMGPHCDRSDSLRYYVTWLKTDNPNTLYDPLPGCRRQSEWDDHGETYSRTVEGPDIWMAVTVPEGIHRLSMYFYNKDGTSGDNRFRDYLIEIRKQVKDYAAVVAGAPLAVARVVNFRGGVYKSFVLCGSASYYVRINRNYSINAIVSSVMIDKLLGPANWTDTQALPWMGGMFYFPPDLSVLNAPDEHLLDKILAGRGAAAIQSDGSRIASVKLAGSVIQDIDALYDLPSAYGLEEPLHLQMYRSLVHQNASTVLLANVRWFSHVWTQDDFHSFNTTMATAHASLLNYNPEMTTEQY
jgi:sugar lactone lactonase YvrE